MINFKQLNERIEKFIEGVENCIFYSGPLAYELEQNEDGFVGKIIFDGEVIEEFKDPSKEEVIALMVNNTLNDWREAESILDELTTIIDGVFKDEQCKEIFKSLVIKELEELEIEEETIDEIRNI